MFLLDILTVINSDLKCLLSSKTDPVSIRFYPALYGLLFVFWYKDVRSTRVKRKTPLPACLLHLKWISVSNLNNLKANYPEWEMENRLSIFSGQLLNSFSLLQSDYIEFLEDRGSASTVINLVTPDPMANEI